MTRVALSMLAVNLALAVTVWSPPTLAQSKFDYRDRGNRSEGVRRIPVSGANAAIELVSFRATYQESLTDLPARFQIRFFLNESRDAFVTVRELNDRYSYWLDKVKPKHAWTKGYGNVFEWPTADVVAHLGLSLYDLGVVVRLGSEHPSRNERVAPAILYHAQPPKSVAGYQFVFRPIDFDGKVEFEIKGMDGTPAKVPPTPRVRESVMTDRPLVITWNAAGVPSGVYRLHARARSSDTVTTFENSVEFAHQPTP